jgi:hypothetical protein
VAAVAAVIRFAGGDTIEVDEELDELLERWKRSGGEPFGVTIAGERAYVSPTQVTCLHRPE